MVLIPKGKAMDVGKGKPTRFAFKSTANPYVKLRLGFRGGKVVEVRKYIQVRRR